MINSLRKRHMRMMVPLLIFVPVVLVLALNGKKTAQTKLQQTSNVAISSSTLEWDQRFNRSLKTVDLDYEMITAKIVATDGDSVALGISTDSGNERNVPDMLLYWHAENQNGSLPANAYLLGSHHSGEKHPQTFELPAEACRVDGYLTFYSLAHQKVYGTSALPTASLLSSGGAQ